MLILKHDKHTTRLADYLDILPKHADKAARIDDCSLFNFDKKYVVISAGVMVLASKMR